jgi:hypothetical protein
MESARGGLLAVGIFGQELVENLGHARIVVRAASKRARPSDLNAFALPKL